MSLLELLRSELTKAMKEKDEPKKTVLRMVMGDAAQTNAVSDTEIHSIMKKMIERNTETISFIPGKREQVELLESENAFLQSFLPRTLSRDEIKVSLSPIYDQLQSHPKEGAAIGAAMKYLKECGVTVDGKDVKQVVLELRGSQDK
jgi:uncharacterized protein